MPIHICLAVFKFEKTDMATIVKKYQIVKSKRWKWTRRKQDNDSGKQND